MSLLISFTSISNASALGPSLLWALPSKEVQSDLNVLKSADSIVIRFSNLYFYSVNWICSSFASWELGLESLPIDVVLNLLNYKLNCDLISFRQAYMIWINNEWICSIIWVNFTVDSETCNPYPPSKDLLTAELILGRSISLSVWRDRISLSYLFIPPFLIYAGLSVKQSTNAFWFYCLIIVVRNVSLQFGVHLWASLIIRPVIMSGLTFLQSRSKTSCLYVTTNTPPTKCPN